MRRATNGPDTTMHWVGSCIARAGRSERRAASKNGAHCTAYPVASTRKNSLGRSAADEGKTYKREEGKDGFHDVGRMSIGRFVLERERSGCRVKCGDGAARQKWKIFDNKILSCVLIPALNKSTRATWNYVGSTPCQCAALATTTYWCTLLSSPHRHARHSNLLLLHEMGVGRLVVLHLRKLHSQWKSISSHS